MRKEARNAGVPNPTQQEENCMSTEPKYYPDEDPKLLMCLEDGRTLSHENFERIVKIINVCGYTKYVAKYFRAFADDLDYLADKGVRCDQIGYRVAFNGCPEQNPIGCIAAMYVKEKP